MSGPSNVEPPGGPAPSAGFRCVLDRIRRQWRQSPHWLQFRGQARRYWLGKFGRSYIAQSLLRRRGHCQQCGMCCTLGRACPFLTRDRRCLIYGRLRPAACRHFPIDERDIEDVARRGGHCSYSFISPGTDANQARPASK